MKYMIQFTKQGYMRYTSHLDMIRLFRRALSRVDVPLHHSQGFNPHPKMSFAQPLSLGYTSVAEYLEFDATGEYKEEEIKDKLNGTVPEGIEVIGCIKLPPSKKTVTSLISWADYIMSIPIEPDKAGSVSWQEQIDSYRSQGEILIEKKKKQGRRKVTAQVDIKSMIGAMKHIPSVEENTLILSVRIASGSDSNLNPEALFKSFAQFAGLDFSRETVRVERRELYFTDWEGKVKPVLEIYDELIG